MSSKLTIQQEVDNVEDNFKCIDIALKFCRDFNLTIFHCLNIFLLAVQSSAVWMRIVHRAMLALHSVHGLAPWIGGKTDYMLQNVKMWTFTQSNAYLLNSMLNIHKSIYILKAENIKKTNMKLSHLYKVCHKNYTGCNKKNKLKKCANCLHCDFLPCSLISMKQLEMCWGYCGLKKNKNL